MWQRLLILIVCCFRITMIKYRNILRKTQLEYLLLWWMFYLGHDFYSKLYQYWELIYLLNNGRRILYSEMKNQKLNIIFARCERKRLIWLKIVFGHVIWYGWRNGWLYSSILIFLKYRNRRLLEECN